MIISEKDTHEAKLLVVDQEEKYSQLEEKLIESIDNRYILKPCGCSQEGGVFQFDISDYEPFSGYLVNRKLSRMEMIGFLAQLKSVIMTMEDHMLTDANLLLNPSWIYIDRMNRKVRFTPVCQLDRSFGERLRPLAEAMFLHADLSDTESLRFASQLLRTSMQPQVRLHDLMRLIENQRNTPGENTYPQAVIAGTVHGRRAARTESGIRGPVSRNMESSPEEQRTMRLTPEQEEHAVEMFTSEASTQELELQKEETGVKGFFSGLIGNIKGSFSNED